MNADIFANFVCLHFNYNIDIGKFPQVLKHANVKPVHKKKKRDKNHCRLVGILPKLSKVCTFNLQSTV